MTQRQALNQDNTEVRAEYFRCAVECFRSTSTVGFKPLADNDGRHRPRGGSSLSIHKLGENCLAATTEGKSNAMTIGHARFVQSEAFAANPGRWGFCFIFLKSFLTLLVLSR